MELLSLLFMSSCFLTLSGLTFGDQSGAAELYVTSHDQINGGVLLQCDVQSGLPKPTVEWRDSNNQVILSEEPQVPKQGGRFRITLKATVKKTDRYHCVATQKEINHQVQKEIHVHLKGFPVWIPIVIGVFVAVIIALVIVIGAKACCGKKGSRRSKNGFSTEMQTVRTSEQP